MQHDISHNIIVALTWIYVNKIFFDLHFYILIVILELHNITVQMAGEKMEIIKVKGNTYCIDTGMTYLPFYKLNNKDIILMDSGYQKECEGIEEALEKDNLRIKTIICSHAHPDHIGNNAYFKGKYNCKIAMTRDEAYICASFANFKSFYDQPMSLLKSYYKNLIHETDIIINEKQDNIILDDIVFKLFHTFGHSPDQICITTPDDVCYLADSLITHETMAGTKIPYAFVLKDDLKSKKSLNQLYSSKYIITHKGISNDIEALIEDNIEYYGGMAQSVYEEISKPMTFEDILKCIIRKFNMEVKSVYKYKMAERMLRSYVEYLYDTGKVDTIIDNCFIKYVRK